MRCFIALSFSETFRHQLTDLVSKSFTQAKNFLRLTKVENLHLTLKFLGDLNQETVEGLIQNFKEESWPSIVHDIWIKGLGVFPSSGTPKVLWAGIEPKDEVQALQIQVEEVCAKMAFSTTQLDFKPHLTLARMKKNLPTEWTSHLFELKNQMLIKTRPKAIVLFQSKLHPQGAIYNPLVCHEFLK